MALSVVEAKEIIKSLCYSYSLFKKKELMDGHKRIFLEKLEEVGCCYLSLFDIVCSDKFIHDLFVQTFSKKVSRQRVDEIRQFSKLKSIYPDLTDLGGNRNKKHKELGLNLDKSADGFIPSLNAIVNLKFVLSSGGTQDHQVRECFRFIKECERNRQNYVCVFGGEYLKKKMRVFLSGFERTSGFIFFENGELTEIELYK